MWRSVMVAGSTRRRLLFNTFILFSIRMEELKQNIKVQTQGIGSILSTLFGIILAIVGILNIILVHAVPGIAYLLISLVYFPFTDDFLKRKTGHAIPGIVKILLAIVLFFFTLGVSDLGDMIV